MQNSTSTPPGTGRKLFSQGEWLTLVGMALCVMSSALVWGKVTPEVLAPGAVGEVYRARFTHTAAGYDLSMGWLRVGWAVVFCGIVCASLLLFDPTPRERPLFRAVHLLMALGVLVIAGLHFGPYPGVILAIIGGLVLLAGGIRRYR